MRKVGEKMPLDDLIVKFSKYCSRCFIAAEKQIESELAYRRDSQEAIAEKRNAKKPRLFF